MLKLNLLFLTAIFFIGCSTFQSTSGDKMKLIQDKTFSSAPDAYLILGSPCGTVKISTWDKEEVNVKIYANENAENDVDFDVKQSGVDVNVTGKIKNESESHNLNVRYEITLPKQYNIEVDTKGGNIEATDLNGTKNLNTMGGNIKLDRADGSINANTMGGNIHISMNNGKVKANTMGGNISLDYTGTNYGIELNTMAGNIHITLPGDFNGDADISTTAGKIICDFAEPVKNYASSSLNAKFNNGGEPIKITTSAGNINVEKSK